MKREHVLEYVAFVGVAALVWLIPSWLFGSESVGLCAFITFIAGYLFSGLILWEGK